MDNGESEIRKTALYRARDIFNQNASTVKLQIVETSLYPTDPADTTINPILGGNWLLTGNIEGNLDGKNIILFRNHSNNFFMNFAKGIALSLPGCIYFLNNASMIEAHVLLNDTYFIESMNGVDLISREVDPVTKLPVKLIDVHARITNDLFPAEGYLAKYSFETLPEGVAKAEEKNLIKYYGASWKDASNNWHMPRESLVSLALHELGHPFGLNHEPRYVNNMGLDTTSANGSYAMDWIGEDMTRFLTKMYPIPANSTEVYRDFSVRHVRHAGSRAGAKIINLSPVNQTGYSVSTRTRAYQNLSDPFTLEIPGSIRGIPFDFLPAPLSNGDYLWDKTTFSFIWTPGSGDLFGNPDSYYRNPVECMAPGVSYYVDFLYENNGSVKNEPDQNVTFYISNDDNIQPTDAVIGQDTISFQQEGDALDPNPLYYWFHPDRFGMCYDIPCLATTRRSKTVHASDIGDTSIALVHRSAIQIPASQSLGTYYIGPYIDPLNVVDEGNEENNATYLAVNVQATCP